MNKNPWQKKIAVFLGNERERLVGYVRRFIDDTAERDGEDIVQDVFVSFAKLGSRFKLRGSLKAYLATSVVNRVRDRMRRWRTESLGQDRHDYEADVDLQGPALRLVFFLGFKNVGEERKFLFLLRCFENHFGRSIRSRSISI